MLARKLCGRCIVSVTETMRRIENLLDKHTAVREPTNLKRIGLSREQVKAKMSIYVQPRPRSHPGRKRGTRNHVWDEKVIESLKASGGSMTISQIANEIGTSQSVATSAIKRLVLNRKIIERPRLPGGTWKQYELPKGGAK